MKLFGNFYKRAKFILYTYLTEFKGRDGYILNCSQRKTIPGKVNLHRWVIGDGRENLGDYLSQVVVDYMLKLNKIDSNKSVGKTKHLYAVGSIIQSGYQNATVWGSGYIDDKPANNTTRIMNRIFRRLRKLDIRCVRGPETRRVLRREGFKCPEIYGDPAVLMPYIYQPKKTGKTKQYSVIRHWLDKSEADNVIEIATTDYKKVIDEIVLSERIVSSSLHGLILSEAYGVPAVLYIPPECSDRLDEFKFRDYYYSTGRYGFPVARSVEEALHIKPCELPDMKPLQDNLIMTFPKDLYVSQP